MTPQRTGRARLVVAAGTLVSVAALLTAAVFTDTADVHVVLDGSQNTFDLQTAGSTDPGWQPTGASWSQGNPTPVDIELGPEAGVLAPGGAMSVRIAARNASPRLAGQLALTVSDPDPLGDQLDPATGTYRELFDQLRFTVSEGATVLMDDVSATELETYAWSEPLPAGASRVVDVRITLPDGVDDRWQRAGTGIRFSFTAVNS